MTEKPLADMSFEDAMAELEQVVTRLEQGEVALDESINLYERGARLRAHCDARLRDAQQKIEKIRLNDSGAPAGTSALETE